MSMFDRRHFLQGSAALGGALISGGIARTAGALAAPIEVPVVDRVVVREITDNQHNIFLKPLERPGLKVTRTGFPAIAQGKTLASEWGLALHIESTKGGEMRRNPFTGEMAAAKPKPASNNIRVRALKALKDMVQ